MAPEQKAGETPSPRSDIYSFCVTLHEAMTGARPGGAPARRPPAWLERAVARGLRTHAAERWPTMRALLDTLARGPRVTLAGVAAVFGIVALALTAGMTARERALASRAPPPCPRPDRAFDGIWDDAGRASVEQALRASGRDESLAYVLRTLDAYRESWSRAEVDTCAATRVRGEQSERLLDLRMACLDDRRRSLGRTVSLPGGVAQGTDESLPWRGLLARMQHPLQYVQLRVLSRGLRQDDRLLPGCDGLPERLRVTACHDVAIRRQRVGAARRVPKQCRISGFVAGRLRRRHRRERRLLGPDLQGL